MAKRKLFFFAVFMAAFGLASAAMPDFVPSSQVSEQDFTQCLLKSQQAYYDGESAGHCAEIRAVFYGETADWLSSLEASNFINKINGYALDPEQFDNSAMALNLITSAQILNNTHEFFANLSEQFKNGRSGTPADIKLADLDESATASFVRLSNSDSFAAYFRAVAKAIRLSLMLDEVKSKSSAQSSMNKFGSIKVDLAPMMETFAQPNQGDIMRGSSYESQLNVLENKFVKLLEDKGSSSAKDSMKMSKKDLFGDSLLGEDFDSYFE